MVRGLPPLDQVDQVCDACLAGKQRRAPLPEQSRCRATNRIDLVHGDMCGPITPVTPSGNQYFLLLVDDMSRFMWLVLLPSKDQAAAAIKNFQMSVEVETGRKLKTLRTDRGGEFTSVEFGRYCAERGVQRQLTAPLLPSAERGGGAAQPERGCHGTVHAQSQEPPWVLLGGSSHCRGARPQQIPDARP
jgi:hypothetical protein